MSKTFSGKDVLRILVQEFGFFLVSQKGSHVKVRRMVGKKIVTTIVPMHRELAKGTLKGILALAEVDEKRFFEKH